MIDAIFARGGFTWAPRFRDISIFIVCLGLALCPLTLPAQSVTIAWNPSTNANVAGYMVYYGTDGTNFDSQINAGTNVFVTVTNLTPGSTNYFEVAEYDVNTNESP